MKNLKKWNWSVFWIILLVACIGALGNKSITNFTDGAILVLCFGTPLGLLFAWTTRDR